MTQGPNSEEKPGLQKLESWKHIASYLNCNERTAKRWELTRNLPVRRLPGARGGVFAMVHEIEAWQMGTAGTAVNEQPVSHPVDHPLHDTDLPPGTDTAPATLTAPVPLEAEALLASGAILPPAISALPPVVAHRSRLGWQLAFSGVLMILLVTSISRLHQTALASRRDVSAHAPSPAARELYLKGRFYWNKRTPQDLKFALATFQQATALDPDYADAYAGIAECYGLATEFASLPADQAYPAMLAAAQKAVALDPNLATAHRALGFALFYWNWDRAGADREFERAIALNPNDATTHHWYGNVLHQSQQYTAAVREMDKARELDPAAPSILADHGLALSLAGKMHEGREDWLELEKTDAAYLPPHWYLANYDLRANDLPAYLAELKTIATISGAPQDVTRASLAEAAFRQGKESAVMNALADYSVQQYAQQHTSAMRVAFAMASARRDHEALQYLQRAYQDRDPIFLILADRREFPSLINEPEYRSLEAKSLLPYPVAQ